MLHKEIIVSKSQYETLRENAKEEEQEKILRGIFNNYDKVKTWEELNIISGYYIKEDSLKGKCVDWGTDRENRNIAPTEKHCDSMLAFAQLSQICAALGDECNVDWSNYIEPKYCIVYHKGEIKTKMSYNEKYFFAFKNEDVCEEFIERNKSLLKQYFMVD